MVEEKQSREEFNSFKASVWAHSGFQCVLGKEELDVTHAGCRLKLKCW